MILGEGYLDSTPAASNTEIDTFARSDTERTLTQSFAPSGQPEQVPRFRQAVQDEIPTAVAQESTISRMHNAWSTAVNSRLGRADNARFTEHFRYTIVASQLLNEFLDQGSLPPVEPGYGLDGASETISVPSVTTSLYGAAATAVVAFALVYLIHWARSGRNGAASRSRVALVFSLLLVTAFVGYAYLRRQWLQHLRRRAVAEVSASTANWQTFEVTASSALSLIQEVELVSKGYRLATPLPPASRVEDQAASRRCVRLRKSLYRAYAAIIPACVDACNSLKTLIDEDDIEKYFEVYDINPQDAREASGSEALSVLEDDAESLKSLRVLSYRAGILRRVTLCSLMALEADGGKPDFYRWRVATVSMSSVCQAVATSAQKLQHCLNDMETVVVPPTPIFRSPNAPARDKMRSQVRKISMLSSGIKGLQAKMQLLREETNRSIEQSEDAGELGPSLMAQYESIGADLKELMQAWEEGKASLQSSITKTNDRRISRASSVRSPVSSIGGLTAVEEGGGPADALKALTGDSRSSRSSLATTPSDEEVFEAVALPRQRSTLTREERVWKMQEERERQAILRAKRDANTTMLRELESVINLRPKMNTSTGMARITSV